MEAEGKHEEILGEKNPEICKLCLKERALYTCPRCDLRYCSSACYKSEGHLQCSENFYRECFMEVLFLDKMNSRKDIRKVLEMLQRLENDEGSADGDSDTETDLESRLAGLNLGRDTDKIWERLTQKEKTTLRKKLIAGQLADLSPMWEPWWKIKKKNLVENANEEIKLKHPAIKDDIPELAKLFPQDPSPLLRFTVINVLYAYAHMNRLFNRNLREYFGECHEEMFKLSRRLKQNQNFTTVAEALHSCIVALQNNKKNKCSRDFNIGIIVDVKNILEGPSPSANSNYVLAAFSDLLKCLQTTKMACIDDDVLKKSLFMAEKKIEFVLSWTVSYGHLLTELIPDLELEFCTLSTELASHRKKQGMIESAWGAGPLPPKPKKLIEDLGDL